MATPATKRRPGRGTRSNPRTGRTRVASRAAQCLEKYPATPLVRTSERQTFNRCLWQWDRNYNDRMQPVAVAPALRFGTLIHAALEQRYPPGIKRGPHPAKVFEKLYAKDLTQAEAEWGFRDSDGEWAKALELGVDMLNAYVDLYGRDEEWKVLASEMAFQVPVFVPDWLRDMWPQRYGDYAEDQPLFIYVGTMDGVWQDRMSQGVRIQDYKTTKGDPLKEAMAKLMLDEQGTAYWTWGVDWLEEQGILKPRELEALDGMLYTFLRKARKDTRPQNADGKYLNKDGSVSQKQPGAYFHRELVYRDDATQEQARQRAIQQFVEMDLRRDGKLPVYKRPGLGYPDQQCNACPYFDICELDEMGQDWSDLAAGSFTTWDPYDAHEVREAETRS